MLIWQFMGRDIAEIPTSVNRSQKIAYNATTLMNSRKIFFTLISQLFLILPSLHSSPAKSQITLINADELSQRKDPISLLDCRDKMAFRKGRIPGSQHVDWKNWTQERGDIFGLWFGKAHRAGLSRIPDEKLQNDLRKLGLSNSRIIVVVGEPGGWGEEGRIAWNLLYWGAEDVALLDGGYEAWAKISSNKPETGPIQEPVAGTFVIQVQPQRKAILDEVKMAYADGSQTLIDNRSSKEFHGKKFWGQKRGGHIPGAISIPVEKLYTPDGLFIDKTALQDFITTQHLNIPISYCVGGVRSALFAMLWETHFGQVVQNYEGSIWEWSNYPELPLEN